jgi:hypothetical protein
MLSNYGDEIEEKRFTSKRGKKKRRKKYPPPNMVSTSLIKQLYLTVCLAQNLNSFNPSIIYTLTPRPPPPFPPLKAPVNEAEVRELLDRPWWRVNVSSQLSKGFGFRLQPVSNQPGEQSRSSMETKPAVRFLSECEERNDKIRG